MTVGKHTATVEVKGNTQGAQDALKALDEAVKRSEKQTKQYDKTWAKTQSRWFELKKAAQAAEGEVERARFQRAFDAAKFPEAQKQTRSLLTSVNALRAGFAGLAVAGIGQAVNTIRELSAESLSLQNIYANLPFNLDEARTATLGLVDDTALATAALQAQRFGVVENAQEFAKLAEVATKLAVTSGQDAAKGIEDLTTALSRQSPMILDNLGITLRLGEAQDRYAETLGKATKDLTDAEKAEAFRVEAMKAAEAATENLTVQTDGFAAALARAEVAAANFRANLLGGGGPAGGGVSPDQVIARMAREAGEVSAQFEDLVDLQERGSKEQQETVMQYRQILRLLESSTQRGADLEELNAILADHGASQAVSAEKLSQEYRDHVRSLEESANLDAQLALQGQQRAESGNEAAEAAADELAQAEALLPIYEQELAVARASGADQKKILGIQQDQLSTQVQIVEAKLLAGVLDREQADTDLEKLKNQQEVLEATQRRAGRTRRRGPSREEQVQQLIDQANAGDRLARAEAARNEMFLAFHEEETQAAAMQLAQTEAQILARERQLEIEETRGTLSEEAKIAREQELLQLQVEAAGLREQLAFDAEAREEAGNAREQLLHEQRVKRIHDAMALEEAAKKAQEEQLQSRIQTSTDILGIAQNAVDGYGAIFSEAAKRRGATEREAFNIEKGIKAASLTLDAVTYGAKSAAAFAGLNFVQGAAFAVAASLSGAAAIQTLAATPDSIGAPGQSAGAGVGGIGGIPTGGPGNERPDSAIPGSPIDGRGSTLPGPGPGAGGGGVSVSIGQFTTLGTVDDETGAKLAQAIDRVKQDGLA